jgi:hypothetical protein
MDEEGMAFAHGHGCSAAIDEKKATRLSVVRFTSLRLITTMDILAHPAVGVALGSKGLAQATFNALNLARMQVREHQFGWVSGLIGAERVAACSSLRRLAKEARETPPGAKRRRNGVLLGRAEKPMIARANEFASQCCTTDNESGWRLALEELRTLVEA